MEHYYHTSQCCQSECCISYPRPPPIPIIFRELKTIALLELSGDGITIYDNAIKKTFEYYFENHSKEFKRFPIVNTESILNKTLQLLEQYYKLGYRIFIGMNRSSILNGVLSWFQQHPDATGISINSTSPTLSIPKNIYRLTPSDDNLINNIEVSPFLLTKNNIFYVYSQGEIATEYVLEALLSPLSPIKDKVVAIPILPDGSNMSDVKTQYMMKGATPFTDATISYLFVENQEEQFIQLFDLSFTPIPTFSISLDVFPEFTGIQKIIWNQLYYAYQNINVSTSPLWREGFEALGKDSYNPISLNALQLNNDLKRKFDLNNLSNYAFVQEFNQNKDIIYFSYSNFVWKNNEWIPDAVFIKDPIFGVIYKTLND
jgi:hypothetical protein